VLTRVRESLGRWRHLRSCRRVLDLPPLTIREAPLSFVSMVSHRDLVMYLVAIRSLYAQIGEGSITVIDDGSLTAADIELLHRSLGEPAIIGVDDIDRGPCPQGGFWERLLHILDLSTDRYVIQVDADTLALGPVEEVVDAYRSNRSFALVESSKSRIATLGEASHAVAQSTSQHEQIVAEKSLSKLQGGLTEFRYVRGCAAFAGFARGGFTRAQAERFSCAMHNEIGLKWQARGTEQVTSNLAVASSPNPVILPHPKYATYTPQLEVDNSVFLHFMGTYRFRSNVYVTNSHEVVSALNHYE
jgi:hypothetical protein